MISIFYGNRLRYVSRLHVFVQWWSIKNDQSSRTAYSMKPASRCQSIHWNSSLKQSLSSVDFHTDLSCDFNDKNGHRKTRNRVCRPTWTTRAVDYPLNIGVNDRGLFGPGMPNQSTTKQSLISSFSQRSEARLEQLASSSVDNTPQLPQPACLKGNYTYKQPSM